jgi:hypothetical protein
MACSDDEAGSHHVTNDEKDKSGDRAALTFLWWFVERPLER